MRKIRNVIQRFWWEVKLVRHCACRPVLFTGADVGPRCPTLISSPQARGALSGPCLDLRIRPAQDVQNYLCILVLSNTNNH